MNEVAKIPFIRMLYEYKGERAIYDCNFPPDLVNHFENEIADEYIIAFFFVMGQPYSKVKTLQDAIQFCKD